MNNRKREAILAKIKELDHNEEIVKIDVLKNILIYNEKIKQHRKINSLTDEEIVRAYFLVVLNKECDYPIEKFELEEEFLIGNKKKNTRVRTDIRLNKNSHSFMIFEVKDIDKFEKDDINDIKTQLFNVAGVIDPRAESLKWLTYCTVDINAVGEVEEIIKLIDYNRFRTFEEWDKAGRISRKLIPKKYGTKIIARYVKGGLEEYKKKHKKDPEFEVLNLKPFIPKERLEKIRKKLHDTLWAGGKKTSNNIFFNLVKLILAKIYDEKETKEGDIYKFQISYKSKDNYIEEDLGETTKNVEELYQKAFSDKEYLGVDEENLKILKKNEGAIDLIEFEDHEIAFILEQFEMYELTNTDFEFLGEFFEAIIREEFKQNTGQYFTHKNIVDFLLYGIEIDKLTLKLLKEEKRLPYIIDPSCGSGTFIIQAMKLIYSLVGKKKEELERESNRLKEFLSYNFPKSKKQLWAQEYIYGVDFSALLGITTKVNMVLHGDGHVHVFVKDALSDFSNFDDKLKEKKKTKIYKKEVNEKFDVILTNPPFATSLDPRTKQKLEDLYTFGSKETSENLFIERYYQLLRENGRLGAVLPESVFDTTENMYIRLFLFKHFWIKAIVSLSGGAKRGAFAPYTATKTCLLLAQKKTEDEIDEWSKVWQKAEQEYYSLLSNLKKMIDIKEKSKDEEKETINLLKSIFKENFEEEDEKKDFDYILEKYKELLKEKKLKEWRIFNEVSRFFVKNYPSKSGYPVFHVEEIGYKRTKRGERKRPNYLYETEIEQGKDIIIINTKEPTKVLDIIRGRVKWD